jgi:hypothetical protein
VGQRSDLAISISSEDNSNITLDYMNLITHNDYWLGIRFQTVSLVGSVTVYLEPLEPSHGLTA